MLAAAVGVAVDRLPGRGRSSTRPGCRRPRRRPGASAGPADLDLHLAGSGDASQDRTTPVTGARRGGSAGGEEWITRWMVLPPTVRPARTMAITSTLTRGVRRNPRIRNTSAVGALLNQQTRRGGNADQQSQRDDGDRRDPEVAEHPRARPRSAGTGPAPRRAAPSDRTVWPGPGYPRMRGGRAPSPRHRRPAPS